MNFASLLQPAHRFLRLHAGREVLVVAMERSAADHIARTLGGSQVGIHRYSLRQLVAAIANESLMRGGKRVLGRLAAEALAAQVIDTTPLAYFGPVARTPGFPTALLETLTKLRLTGEDTPDGDLRLLASAYERVLLENSLADGAMQLEAAIKVATFGKHRLLGLPTLLIDLVPDNALEREFLFQVSFRASVVESLESEHGSSGGIETSLLALQDQLFAEQIACPASREGVTFFSASGEALECVEITRRILESGLPFDECAVLLRHPTRYQPLMEDALRRAAIPAWFTHVLLF